MSTLPGSTIYLSILTKDWKFNTSSGVNSDDTSNLGQEFMVNGDDSYKGFPFYLK